MEFLVKVVHTLPKEVILDVYLRDLGLQMRIPKMYIAILRWILNSCQPDGTIVIVKDVKQAIAAELDTAPACVVNCLGFLVGRTLLKRVHHAGYMINPDYLMPSAKFTEVATIKQTIKYQSSSN